MRHMHGQLYSRVNHAIVVIEKLSSNRYFSAADADLVIGNFTFTLYGISSRRIRKLVSEQRITRLCLHAIRILLASFSQPPAVINREIVRVRFGLQHCTKSKHFGVNARMLSGLSLDTMPFVLSITLSASRSPLQHSISSRAFAAKEAHLRRCLPLPIHPSISTAQRTLVLMISVFSSALRRTSLSEMCPLSLFNNSADAKKAKR